MKTWEEAEKRMSRRGTRSIRWTLADVTIEYKYIQANQARNWDGSHAGDEQDVNRVVLQKMVWRDGGRPYYSNRW